MSEDLVLDIKDLIKAKTAPKQTCYILLNPELEERRAELQRDLAKAENYDEWHNEKDLAPAIKQQIEEIDKEIAASRVPFVFQSMGRRAYSALLDEFKPREGNEDDADAGFDIDEFPPRLISLSSYSPKIPLEEARVIWDEWSDAETTLILGSAVLANKEVVDVPFTHDGLPMGTRSTVKPSPTATPKDSPTQSS